MEKYHRERSRIGDEQCAPLGFLQESFQCLNPPLSQMQPIQEPQVAQNLGEGSAVFIFKFCELLCLLCVLILLGFCDTLQTPPKPLGNSGLQAGQLAGPGGGPPAAPANPPATPNSDTT